MANAPDEKNDPEPPPQPGDADQAPTLPPLRSVHTDNLPEILRQLGISLIVSTYQAGKLVFFRADGAALNTHFRGFNRPMGVALEGDRLAIGTGLEIWEYHNSPAIARRLPPPGKHDACFLPRHGHVTGDIQIHEMGWGGEELWFVNTRFSCLCTRHPHYSFVPRWRPAFVTALVPEDRCHLNGLCLIQGHPAFVTALGETDTKGGWRANKKDGGILIEVATGKILLRGLSMPHSPRWYNDRLWLLDSGKGGLGYLDPVTLRYERVAELPGFTRGLDFCGPLAFVGLSQVRESAVFSGIPIAEKALAERNCGVWVVNIENRELIGFVRFEEAVQEIFAVQVMPGKQFPELINQDQQLLADSFVIPDLALADVPADLRFPAQPSAPG
jgi:uncharacterized protein (TIGR03032 family)